MLKLQESPDAVPKGEMPRHMQLFCDRYLTDRIVPGNRISVMGIYSIRKSGIKPPKVSGLYISELNTAMPSEGHTHRVGFTAPIFVVKSALTSLKQSPLCCRHLYSIHYLIVVASLVQLPLSTTSLMQLPL